MQRKPGFPVANCSIKMPDASTPELCTSEEDWEPPQRRQQLINFGHSQWGFNNWSWSVSKQDLDFVDCVGNKCTAGVAAFVLVTVKSFDIHRENVGYATAVGPNKGSAIHRARKCAVTNALRETLLSFGGTVAKELIELLDTNKVEAAPPPPEPLKENNQNVPNKQEPKNSPVIKNIRKDSSDSAISISASRPAVPPTIKNVVLTPAPPVAKAHPMPANLPPAANVPRAPRPPAPPAPHPPPQHQPHPPHPQHPQQPQHQQHQQHQQLPQHPQHAHMRPNSNEVCGVGTDTRPEEEARAERKRRQRLAQEEFRLKQLLKQKTGADEALPTDNSSVDNLLIGIKTQDIELGALGAEEGKRKSPSSDQPDCSNKRRSVELDIL